MDTNTATLPLAPLSLQELTRRERAEAKTEARRFRANPTFGAPAPYGAALRARLGLPR